MADSAQKAEIPVFALSLALTNRAARSAVQLLSADAGEQLLEDADLRDEATLLLHRLFGHGDDGRRRGRCRFDLQNGGQGREGDMMVNLWLSSGGDGAANGEATAVDNAAVLQRLKNWTLVLMGTSRPRRRGQAGSDFLVVDLVALPPWSVESLTDTVSGEVVFDWGGRHASGIPDDVLALIRTLPPRRLPRNRVRMLLGDWERFLKTSEELAEAKTFVLNYTGYRLEATGRTVRFEVTVPEGFDRRKVRAAAKELLHLERTADAEQIGRAPANDRGANHQNARDRSQVIGTIQGLQGTRLTVALDKDAAAHGAARGTSGAVLGGGDPKAQVAEGHSVLPKKGRLAYKALGELAQVRRLRWGLESLLRGRSKNPRLGEFLFDGNEAGLPDPQTVLHLSREELLQPSLNEGQLRAVEGALNAPDLYLIQGPPGTGKTTVIAEICYQVAMRGGRTMVASQANLAVDHAMSRLVHHPSIRALRRGRAERVEEEGKPYLEDYVIGTWLDKVARECRGDLDARHGRLAELQHLVHLRTEVDAFDTVRARYGSESRPLKAAVRQAKRAHQAATLSLSSAQALRTELQETGQFLVGLRTFAADAAAGTADGAAVDLLTRPAHSADAWARIWEPAVREGMQTLQALEQAIEAWTVPEDGVRVGEASDPGSDALDGRIFTGYVRRGWLATEMASRIAAHAADVEPKIEALSELCEAWYELVVREQPLLDRRRARRMASSEGRARMAEMQATIARYEATIEDLRKLKRGMGRVHREILTWLLRRATAEGPVSEVPQSFQIGTRREIWEAAARGQRLPSLRGVAAKAREGRDAAETLGRMASQIDRCVGRLLTQVSPGVLAAVEQGPLSWRESVLADLVAVGADGLLRPAREAESGLRPFLQTTLTLAMSSDPRRRIPEMRVAANIVGLRGMATDLQASRQQLTRAAGVQAEEFQSIVRRLTAALAANLRATVIAQQHRLTITVQMLREESAGIEQLAEIRTDHTEEGAALEQLAGEKALAAHRIEEALDLDGAWDRLPLQRLRQIAAEAVSVTRDVWERDWQDAQQALSDARAALAAAEARFDPDAVLASWVHQGEAALMSAEEEAAAAEAGVATATERLVRAEAVLAELEDAYAGARLAWVTAYETLPEGARPETQSITSSATLELVRRQCTLWEAERESLQTYLDSYTEFISGWVRRVASRNQRDEADLRQIYIDNANVIGITCVHAGARAFSERYRDFDTVIVDEVSKATPPELLLPMLKGGKVILVGDSRQLPPMVGPAALQDLAESLGVGARDLAHLERSLFRDLFERSPVQLKSWLTDQYRMHPQIMDAINQFYNEKLVCRIESPDTSRAHHLEPLIPALTHIAWIPTPWSKAFYETRVGTSRCNDKEVEIIGNLVYGINELWGQGPEDRLPKEIGVITFYAAQERALRGRLLDRSGEQQYEHLDVRLGTVDRFQGMEKPVIIVSLVCNNPRRDIGFARALERINVAFSRAQELLVIVGSRELFSRQASAARATERYSRVAEVVSRSGGDLNVSDFITR